MATSTNPRTGKASVFGRSYAPPRAARNMYQPTSASGRRTLPAGKPGWGNSLVAAQARARYAPRWRGSHWATGKDAPVRTLARKAPAATYTAAQVAARGKYGY